MSAFGTCGLSLGITGDVSSTTKLILMLLMFIGRVGLISFIIMIGGRREPDKFHYPKERVQIININNINISFVVLLTSPVIPNDKPQVPKADMTSKNACKKLSFPFSTTSITIMLVKVNIEAIVKTANDR